MGSYGIGISRLVGAIIEAFHDDRGIIWPIPVAPFHISLINLMTEDDKCNEVSENLYNNLVKKTLKFYMMIENSVWEKNYLIMI